MATPKKASRTYLRFVNLVNAIRNLPSVPPLDATEERVLNGLAAVWATGARITVMESIDLFPEISPSTVHRRLKSLQQKGLVALHGDDADSRIRIIEPTDAALDWFVKLGQCLSAAARET